jgi:hypothetical protein
VVCGIAGANSARADVAHRIAAAGNSGGILKNEANFEKSFCPIDLEDSIEVVTTDRMVLATALR